MLNKVRIFEALVLNSKLDSNFTNSKFNSRKLYCLVTGTCVWAACPRLLPGSGLAKIRTRVRALQQNHMIWHALVYRHHRSAACRQYRFIFTEPQICQLRLSRHSFIKLPHWSAHPCGSKHQTVILEILEYSSFTALNMSTVARTSPALNGNYPTPRNIKVRSTQATSVPGPPVLACRSAAWVVVQRAASGRTMVARWRSTYACCTAWSGQRAQWSRPAWGILLSCHHHMPKSV